MGFFFESYLKTLTLQTHEPSRMPAHMLPLLALTADDDDVLKSLLGLFFFGQCGTSTNPRACTNKKNAVQRVFQNSNQDYIFVQEK